jgi:putative tricarboxylic transport membrane protein
MTTDRLSGSFLVLLSLFVAIETRVLPLGSHKHPGPGYFPLLLAILIGILGLILIVQGKGTPPLRSINWEEAPHALAILVCTFVATFGIETLGYRITMILILGFLFGVMERIKLWQTGVLTLGLSLGTFWVFDTWMKVILPRGGWGF